VGAGSSGGPVIDLSGHVVGVCLAVLGGGGGGRGLGVALPGSLAARVAHDLERDGHSAHGFAGVALAEENGGGAAVRVAAVVPGGPADQAGIRAGDRVLSLDGRPAHDARELRHRLFTTAPGAVSRIDLARAGARVDTALRVQPLPAAGGW
jgi:S1-C subfamily serine protease